VTVGDATRVYAVMGVNYVKCNFCGRGRDGRSDIRGGNVPITVGPVRYAQLLHDCEIKVSGRCLKCGRVSEYVLYHQPAPIATTESILEMQAAFKRRLGREAGSHG